MGAFCASTAPSASTGPVRVGDLSAGQAGTRAPLNRIVKIVTNRASRYRHPDHFAVMIYLTVGNLDILAQILSHLRTL